MGGVPSAFGDGGEGLDPEHWGLSRRGPDTSALHLGGSRESSVVAILPKIFLGTSMLVTGLSGRAVLVRDLEAGSDGF